MIYPEEKLKEITESVESYERRSRRRAIVYSLLVPAMLLGGYLGLAIWQVRGLETRKDRLQVQVKNFKSQVTQLQEDKGQLQTQMRGLETQKNQLQKSLDSLEERLDLKEEELATKEEELANKIEEISIIDKQLGDLNNRVPSLDDQNVQREIGELQSSIRQQLSQEVRFDRDANSKIIESSVNSGQERVYRLYALKDQEFSVHILEEEPRISITIELESDRTILGSEVEPGIFRINKLPRKGYYSIIIQSDSNAHYKIEITII